MDQVMVCMELSSSSVLYLNPLTPFSLFSNKWRAAEHQDYCRRRVGRLHSCTIFVRSANFALENLTLIKISSAVGRVQGKGPILPLGQ